MQYWKRIARWVQVWWGIMLNAQSLALGTNMLRNFYPVPQAVHLNPLTVTQKTIDQILSKAKSLKHLGRQKMDGTSKSNISSSAFQSGQIRGKDKLSWWKNWHLISIYQSR